MRDLLVAPLQRLTRYPLLLRNVGKRSRTEEEESALQSVAEQVDTSICEHPPPSPLPLKHCIVKPHHYPGCCSIYKPVWFSSVFFTQTPTQPLCTARSTAVHFQLKVLFPRISPSYFSNENNKIALPDHWLHRVQHGQSLRLI